MMEHPIKIDDLGVSYFRKTPYTHYIYIQYIYIHTVHSIYIYIYIYICTPSQIPRPDVFNQYPPDVVLYIYINI